MTIRSQPGNLVKLKYVAALMKELNPGSFTFDVDCYVGAEDIVLVLGNVPSWLYVLHNGRMGWILKSDVDEVIQ